MVLANHALRSATETPYAVSKSNMVKRSVTFMDETFNMNLRINGEMTNPHAIEKSTCERFVAILPPSEKSAALLSSLTTPPITSRWIHSIQRGRWRSKSLLQGLRGEGPSVASCPICCVALKGNLIKATTQ